MTKKYYVEERELVARYGADYKALILDVEDILQERTRHNFIDWDGMSFEAPGVPESDYARVVRGRVLTIAVATQGNSAYVNVFTN